MKAGLNLFFIWFFFHRFNPKFFISLSLSGSLFCPATSIRFSGLIHPSDCESDVFLERFGTTTHLTVEWFLPLFKSSAVPHHQSRLSLHVLTPSFNPWLSLRRFSHYRLFPGLEAILTSDHQRLDPSA